MITDRRGFLQSSLTATIAAPIMAAATKAPREAVVDNKKLGTIYNDDGNALGVSSGKDISPAEYKATIGYLLDGKPNVLALCVGEPDCVSYQSQVATNYEKHLVEVTLKTWPTADGKIDPFYDHIIGASAKLASLGTDPLRLAISVCRRRGVAFMASYRMNSEDWYGNTWQLSDFGRAHPEWRIPGAGCLDPAIPEVYAYRMKIFAEVARQYDVDGVEFDFRRWTRMISEPLENYSILTKMVRETRQMLDQAAGQKRRKRMLLGVRVGSSLADPPGTEYPGGEVKTDISCRELGLDVKTWIEEELVDYVCPSLFWPRLPGLPKTAEFAILAKSKNVGIYPTIFPIPKWISEGPIAESDIAKRLRYRGELGAAALRAYQDGADGLSTFNWVQHHQPGMVKYPMREKWGLGCIKEQMAILPHFRSAAALREYLRLG